MSDKSIVGKAGSFLKDDILSSIHKDVFLGTVEQFLALMLSDDPTFRNEYRRDDTNLIFGKWRASKEYDGEVREVTYRYKCNGGLIGPPETAVTETQHYILSTDKKRLVFETIQQAHDVPYGSYFEVHSRISVVAKSETTCTIEKHLGVYFRKWCILQSPIKSRSVSDHKKAMELILKAAPQYIK